MITVSLEIILIFGLAISTLYYFIKSVNLNQIICELKQRISKPEIRYADQSGITENPPVNFVDVWKGKTLNIKVNKKHNVIVPQIPAKEALNYLAKIGYCYAIINSDTGNDNSGTIVSKLNQLYKWTAYKKSINYIYEISKHFEKPGYKKALFKRCKNDYTFTLETLEQINDYWQLLKKKALLLSKGTTLRQTDGYSSTWQDLKLDAQGKRLIVPLCA